MKTQKELNALKEEVETVSRKLHELTEEELEQVTGGKPPASIPYIVTATAPVLIKMYNQVNDMSTADPLIE